MADEPGENKTTVPHNASQIRGMEEGRRRPGNANTGYGGRRRGEHSDSSPGGGSGQSRRGDHASSDSAGTSRNRDDHSGSPSSSKGDSKSTPSPSELNGAENEGLYNSDDSPTRRSKAVGFYKRYRKQIKIGAGVGGIGITGAVMLFSVTQGPLQFVHFAQLLQQFHMTSNEDFSDDRTTKILIYALSGKGGERGRLSVKANIAADIWERQIEKELGIRPVYTKLTRKNIGWEIVDKDKFFNKMLDISASDSKNTAAIERVMGKGAEIRTVGEVSAGKQGVVPGGESPELSKDTLMLDTSNQPPKEKRILTRAIGREVHTSQVISAIGGRLLIKRGGVDYHPLENRRPRPGEKLADWYSRLRDNAAKEDINGAKDTKLAKDNNKDASGKSESTPEIDGATDATNEAVDAAKASPGTDTLKVLVKGLGKGAAAVGVLCAAKSIGNNVDDYKYLNNALPMMRMGTRMITMGNQIMSGEGFNIQELAAFNPSFYDPETKTNEMNAKSVQGEMGEKQTGPDLPPEARLQNVDDKPAFFDALDKIRGLDTVCGVSEAATNLPIIKQVSDAASSVVFGGLNVAASAFGTSVEGMMQDALAAISGQSTNTKARGAEQGGLDNTGVFLSANDTAIASGGVPLDQSDVIALKSEASSDTKRDNSTKSVAQRYLNPYDRTTLVAAAIDRLPSSKGQLASMVSSPLTSFADSISTVTSNLNPNAYAFGSYDYGVPKFGFSPADRDNPEFDDPFENAAIVEKPGVLDELNAKYGKPCFGMTVTAGPDGTSVETESMGSDNLNVFKVLKKPECSPPRTVSSLPSSPLISWLFPKAAAAAQKTTGNTDPMFRRYRFYLADAVNTDSLACLYGDNATCTNLGFPGDSAAASSPAAAATTTADATIDMATLYDSSVDVACAPNTKDVGIQDGYREGKKVPVRTCAISNMPSSSSEASNGLTVVNSRVSAVMYSMAEAAKKAGVNPSTSSGFRSMQLQECLYAHGCGWGGGAVASPGTSNHQMGLAIDVDDGSEFHSWMIKNGEKFGYKWYGPGDSVHFSPTGD